MYTAITVSYEESIMFIPTLNFITNRCDNKSNYKYMLVVCNESNKLKLRIIMNK